MEKKIQIYDLHDPRQYEDEKAYWKSKTPKERLHALETIRKTGNEFLNYDNQSSNGDQQRLQRVLRVVERE